MSWLDIQHHYVDVDPADQADSIKVLRTTTHTARKAHPCTICEGQIQPGQRYQLDALLDSGTFSLNRHHLDGAECQEAAKLRKAWEKERAEIEALVMAEELILAQAGQCHTCSGFGLDPARADWTRCPTCGGAGTWDQGETVPDAIAATTLEPRIPATLPPVHASAPPQAHASAG